METILEVKGLTKRFGGLTAVNNVSFDVREKEILSVIGPNGAGKSTLFKLIASFLNPTSGEVIYRARRFPALPRTSPPARVWCALSRKRRFSKT
jgi:branched-chain amino acid transport system ATP-binding protein